MADAAGVCEHVVAQGQENSARGDLSFIERARLARRLEELGYDRRVIMEALSTDKTTLSTMISVTERIPAQVLEMIGPARVTGRPDRETGAHAGDDREEDDDRNRRPPPVHRERPERSARAHLATRSADIPDM